MVQDISRGIGLYIHIPFCATKCAYCTFNSFPQLECLHSRYAQALSLDMLRFSHRTGSLTVDTVYIGGGTPTILQPLVLQTLLNTCRAAFDVAHDTEITVEANPGTVTLEQLKLLRQSGVNRLSLGVQSFLDSELRLLGRIHGAAEALSAVELARQAGFHNINVDLIYGLPGQRVGDWLRTLERAVDLAPEHLSLYALSVEADTPFGQRIRCGQLRLPDDDEAAQMYAASEDWLARSGYEHYELSNWAATRLGHNPVPGALACRHNLKYWQLDPYLGFGAGAHSFYEHQRWSSLSDPWAYCEAVEAGHSPIDHSQTIGPVETMAEMMILGLRLCRGVCFDEFQARHGCDLREEYRAQIQDLQHAGLLEVTAEGVGLTPRGRLLGNRVFVEFWRTDSGN